MKALGKGCKKFTRKELERLGRSEEDISLVLEYQDKLPILIENDNTEIFCVNARDLWTQLGVKAQFADWFSKRVKSYKFAKNVDFTAFSSFGEKARSAAQGRPSKDYLLTMDMAKQLCMIERNEIGLLCRRYYILMETIVREDIQWHGIRTPERLDYKPLCAALSEFSYRMCGRPADKALYSREANFLNIIAMGVPA